MYHVSAQGIDERMINVHYYYYYLNNKNTHTEELVTPHSFSVDFNVSHGNTIQVKSRHYNKRLIQNTCLILATHSGSYSFGK